MQDILLINGQIGNMVLVEPLPICCLAAYLRKNGYNTHMYHPLDYGGSVHDHLRRILEEEFEFVGISVFTEKFRRWIYWLVEKIRQNGFKRHICVGGLDPSLNWERYLEECKGIDSVVIGDGEHTLLELVDSLFNGEDWQEINGIAFRNGEEVVKNTERELIEDLDSLPFMARDFLEKYVKRFGKGVWASMLAGRGCHQKCSYCPLASYQNKSKGSKIRHRSVRNIVSEMLGLYDKFRVTKFYFHGTSFLSPGEDGLKRLQMFCDEMAKLPFKVQFRIQTTVDVISEQTLLMLKRAGLIDLSVCIDAFVDKNLDLYNLGFRSQRALRTFEMIHACGFSVKVGSPLRLRAGFILFNPYTTIEDLKKQIPIFRKYGVSPKKLAEKVKIYAHSELEKELKRKNLLGSRNEYNFIHHNVSVFHRLYQRYYHHVALFRTRIRNLEKTVDQFAIEVDLTNLRKVRGEMDNSCYDFFEGLLPLSEQPNYEQLMIIYYKRLIQRFNERFKVEELEARISLLEEQLGISKEMRDMYM